MARDLDKEFLYELRDSKKNYRVGSGVTLLDKAIMVVSVLAFMAVLWYAGVMTDAIIGLLEL